QSREIALFSFVAECGELVTLTDREARDKVHKAVCEELETHAQKSRGTVELLSDFRFEDIAMLPFVFVATNAKQGMSLRHLDQAIRLVQRLKTYGLYPLNVDVSFNPLRQEVEDLIKLCPIMISLHLPEKDNLLERTGSSGDLLYSPSDY